MGRSHQWVGKFELYFGCSEQTKMYYILEQDFFGVFRYFCVRVCMLHHSSQIKGPILMWFQVKAILILIVSRSILLKYFYHIYQCISTDFT